MTASTYLRKFAMILRRHLYFSTGLILTLIWCVPYFSTGQRLEWGDFSFFAQSYEAIRISILDYGQFPWWNPWVSGGVPLYANPQIGVFSPQTLLVLIFGAPVGLKFAIAGYTVLGYLSMYLLLRKFFKIESLFATLLSLAWIFCSFFVAHLPAHVTFAWYMLAPLFVYASLTFTGWKGGVMLGTLFAIMALSQTHNPFVHIALICGIIVVSRLVINKNQDKLRLLKSILVAALIFLTLAGHRIVMSLQNLHDFPRNILDNLTPVAVSIYGFILPYSPVESLSFLRYPGPPDAQHGFGEVTATIGISTLFALITAILFCVYRYKNGLKLTYLKVPMVVLGLGLLCFIIALGAFSTLAPYNIIKQLPVLSDMRVSTRWFIWANFFFLIFIGVVTKITSKKSFARLIITALLVMGVAELFVFNVGYQARIFKHEPATTQYRKDLSFEQQSYFGSMSSTVSGSVKINSAHKSQLYREYDSMFYNMGVLYANDALVQIHLANTQSPRCGIDKGCGFVLSDNANIETWSPNKISLIRTGPGDIILNTNKSSYMLINGIRYSSIEVAEPFESFEIKDRSNKIIIEYSPSITESLRGVTRPKPMSYYN